MSIIKVKKAVIPAAGLGSRMHSFSQFLPKELLPYGTEGHPMIWHSIKEIEQSGIKDIAIVLRKGKEEIRTYLTKIFGRNLNFTFCYQKGATGIVDAILSTKSFIENDYFLLYFPDHLFSGRIPASVQLLKQIKKEGVWESAVKVPQTEARFFPNTFGVIYSNKPHIGQPESISEKEANKYYKDKPHQWRTFGRIVYPPSFFEHLAHYKGKDSEGIKNAYWQFIKEVNRYVVPLKGYPMDLGTLEGYGYYLTRQIAAIFSPQQTIMF